MHRNLDFTTHTTVLDNDMYMHTVCTREHMQTLPPSLDVIGHNVEEAPTLEQ